MDRNRNEIMPVLEQTYGQADAVRWFNRWRMFYLACSELFGYRGGDEWWVSHYLFSNKP
jgi:cyclopropane-fatty-acyl-phospholipid synthase